MVNLGDMEIKIEIDPAALERFNKSMDDAMKRLTEAAGIVAMSIQQVADKLAADFPVMPYAAANYIQMLEDEKSRRFAVGDGQTEIVTDPAAIGWNEVMQGLAEVGEKVAQFGRDMEHDKIKARQRVKDDVRRKRKDVMRRRKL